MNNYAYISGLIKYREKKLLNPTDIERMVNAKNGEEAFRVFNDTDYADNLLDVSALEYQQALDDDLKQIKELFSKYLELALLKFLFLNARLFLFYKKIHFIPIRKQNTPKYIVSISLFLR